MKTISEILDEQKNIEGKTGYQLKIEKLEQQVVDYETDWIKMRGYYDRAMMKVNEVEKASIQSALTLTDTIIQMSKIEEKLAETEKALKEACEELRFWRYTSEDGIEESDIERCAEFLAKMEVLNGHDKQEVKNGNG